MSTLDITITDDPPTGLPFWRQRTAWLWIGITALLVSLGSVGFLVVSGVFGAPAPGIQNLITAHQLEGQHVVGETHVFAPGDEITFIFEVASSLTRGDIEIQIVDADGPVKAEQLGLSLDASGASLRAVSFTPAEEGIYTATLYLDEQPILGEETVFKVVPGGPKLREAQTTRSVDSAYKTTDPSTSFAPKEIIYIAYRVKAAESGDSLQVKYYLNGEEQQINANNQTRFDQTGNFRGYFAIESEDKRGLRFGHYCAELFYNGDLVAVVDFEVREQP
ncbi:MAG: hypothetical protein MI924_23570 [Chloroflexales bacterium]|nr:hypothetical protein [Chloroflexales bacterium]